MTPASAVIICRYTGFVISRLTVRNPASPALATCLSFSGIATLAPMPVELAAGKARGAALFRKPTQALQFQYVDVNKLNSAGTTQIGQRFETIAARAQAAW